jgi:hypothetical protein
MSPPFGLVDPFRVQGDLSDQGSVRGQCRRAETLAGGAVNAHPTGTETTPDLVPIPPPNT